jgi:predicted ester cyclase
MSVQENKEIVRRFLEAFNAHDLEALDELTASEYQQRVHNGLARGQSTYPGHHVEITDMVAEGDKVWVRLATSGGYAGGWLDIPASDAQWTNTGVYFYRLSGGKIAEGEGLFDVLNHIRQLGAKVVPIE